MTRIVPWITTLAVCLQLSACDNAEDLAITKADIWFEDVTESSGLTFRHVRAIESRYWLPEIMSGGAAWLDYDSDGDPDLYLVQGGSPDPADGPLPGNQLFRNDAGRFVDVTEESGTGDSGYGMGVAAADYDRDGDLDLFVTNVGANVLYRNDGDGRFSDVSSESGVNHEGWGASAAWLDYDRDGDLDLYVTNYVNWSPAQEMECYSGGTERDYCHPRHFNAPALDVLYRNDDGHFTDVSEVAGIWLASGYGLGVVSGDFNADGWPDLYVANDGMPNQLWINKQDGRFEDQALLAGVAVNMTGAAEAGMGIAVGDPDADGDEDLFVTHLRGETNTLYQNQGGWFEDITAVTGLAAPGIPLTGFGTGFVDFDNDGVLDLYVGNGKVGKGSNAGDPFAEPNQVFHGLGDARFVLAEPQGGTESATVDTSRAVAFADYDLDGAVDLVVVNNGGEARLLRNTAGQNNNWLALDVQDDDGSEALSAQIRVATASGNQYRTVRRAESYLSSSSGRVHIGLGVDDSADVTVVWPDGAENVFSQLPAGRLHVLVREP